MPEEKDIPKPPEDAVAKANPDLKDSSISQSETQTINMEVHHHPDIHHKRKYSPITFYWLCGEGVYVLPSI